MPWAHCSGGQRRLLVLAVLLAGLCCAVPPAATASAPAVLPPTPTNVSSTAGLLAALQDPSVTSILLTGDVQLGDLGNASLPIRLDSRSLTIAGPVPLATPANASKGAALDFQGLWPLLALGRNASLTLRDVSVRGVPPVEAAAGSPYPWRAAEVLTPGFLLGGWALALYPSIILEDGSQLQLVRTALSRVQSVCSAQYFADGVAAFQTLLGGDVQLLSSHSAVVKGNHTFPLPLRSGPRDSPADAGNASLELVGPNTFACSQPSSGAAPGGSGQDAGDSGGLSGGAWAGIGVAIAAAVAAAAGLATLIAVRRRRARTASSSSGAASRLRAGSSGAGSGGTPAEGEGAAEASDASLLQLRRQQASAGVGSLLRVRFGGLEGLEIGSLIGRGAFGRVYAGRLRGVPVAVKVVEHSVDADASTPSSGPGPATEALLLTSLSHPCIVSVFKTATLRVQGAWGLAPGGVASNPESSGRPASGSADVSGPPDSHTAVVGSAALSTVSTESAGLAASPRLPGRPEGAAAPAVVAEGGSGAGAAAAEVTQAHARIDITTTTGPDDMAPVNLAALEAGQAAALAARRLSGQRSSGSAADGRGSGPGCASSGSAGRGSGPGGASSGSAGRGSRPVGEGTAAAAGAGPSSLVPTEPGQYETWIVMQYCELGSLEQAIQRRLLWRPDGTRREALLYGILTDVAEGLCYLHEANVVHGDLKPGNVLLKSAGQGRLRALIADFGLSKLLPGGQHSLVRTQVMGTAQYSPPEALAASRISRATDIYSLAMLILEAFSGAPPFPGLSVAAVFFSVVHQQQRPALPPDMPLPLAALVCDCWQQQPEDRPPIQQVLASLRDVQTAAAGTRGSRGNLKP